MPVGNEIEALVLILEGHPVVQGADEMTKMELARRPHAGDNARFHGIRILIRKFVGGVMNALAAPVNMRA